jgi:hypothetical protein
MCRSCDGSNSGWATGTSVHNGSELGQLGQRKILCRKDGVREEIDVVLPALGLPDALSGSDGGHDGQLCVWDVEGFRVSRLQRAAARISTVPWSYPRSTLTVHGFLH